MSSRHTIRMLSNVAWLLWVLAALAGYAWLIVAHPVIALIWLMLGFSCLALILPMFAINRRDD